MTTLQIVAINILSMIWFLLGGYFYIRASGGLRKINEINEEIQETKEKIFEINRKIQRMRIQG